METIESFIGGKDFGDFVEDDKTSSAVIRKFEITGEAVKHIPEWVKDKYPDIPWKEMAGMKDRLIHAYFGIDFRPVWDTIKRNIPELKSRLLEILLEETEE